MSEALRGERASLVVSGNQAYAAVPLPGEPAVLLSGTRINAAFPSSIERDVKLKDHREWAARAGRVEHVLVDDARHYIQNESPRYVIAAITAMVGKGR